MQAEAITTCRVGVLGGGQLGKMLALAAGNWHLPIALLDDTADFPAGPFAHTFVEGSFRDYDAVYQFGKTVDVLTIEIEHVNEQALFQLEAEGVTIHPRPGALAIIKDKGTQKQFYADQGIPTAPFQLFTDAEAVHTAVMRGQLSLPFVQKSRTAGYDGRGVLVVRTPDDLERLLPGACVIEELVDMALELAVIVARNASGEVKAFSTVEMDFNPQANLVEFLVCPARIPAEVEAQAQALARQVIEAYDICGLLAVELFLTHTGELLVNEVAPRPHNSGHHTIDSCETSQFEQHLRGILDLPLGSTRVHSPAVMVNVLGADGFTGPVRYQGLGDCLALPGVHPHLYGKAETKPFRKMGHVTITNPDLEEAIRLARQVQKMLRVIA